MATYQKRGHAWRAIVRKKETTTSKTFDSKTQAIDWATAVEAKIAAGDQIYMARQHAADEGPQGRTVADLFKKYGDEVSPTKRGGRWEQLRLQKLARDYDTFQKLAVNYTGPDLAEWRDLRLTEVSPASVRREINTISAVFTRAIREWRLGLPANPCSLISKPPKPRARTQRVPDDARKAIVKWLGWDETSTPQTPHQWAAATFCFALATAMRRGEIVSLQWKNVFEAERYAHLDKTKNGDERNVPLSSVALALLKAIGRGEPNEKVFKITAANVTLLTHKAREKTGLLHIRFHDTRRESTTRFSTKLGNVLELAAITGHRDLRTLRVYYAPKPSYLADKLDA